MKRKKIAFFKSDRKVPFENKASAGVTHIQMRNAAPGWKNARAQFSNFMTTIHKQWHYASLMVF